MELQIDGIGEGEAVPSRFALYAVDGMSDNVSPGLSWSGAPDGTASIAITCVDPDAPTDPTDVNVEGRTVSASLPRADFAHWLLADLPADCAAFPEGLSGSGVIAGGKSVDERPLGGVRGANDYTSWFEGDADMGGTYGGYDGPCPPTNDELLHHYVFTVHALDVASLGLDPGFRLADFNAAIDGHVVDSASVTATYSLNPEVA